MAVEVSCVEEVVDSAVGAVSVTRTIESGLDIDDFVAGTVVAQAINLQLSTLVDETDPRSVKDRTKVTVNGKSVGGY